MMTNIRTVILTSLIALVVCAPRRDKGRGTGGFFQRFRPSSATKTSSSSPLLDTVLKHREQVQCEVSRLSREVNDLARQRGTALKDAAVQTAETKRRRVEKEALRLTREVETLTQQKAGEYEQVTRSLLVELERSATMELQRLALVAEKLAQEKAAQAEASAKLKLVEMETAATEKVTSWIRNIGTKKPKAVAGAKVVPPSVSGPMLMFLRLLVLSFSIGNTLGFPPQVVELWEKQGLADEFFPWEGMLVTHKRMLAGCLEFCGFLLLTIPTSFFGTTTTRTSTTITHQTVGAALVTLLFARGAILNAKRETWQMLVPGFVACLALTLFLNDVVSAMPGPLTNKTTRRRRNN